VWVGCGTTKWTDTSRTATEQLLLSDSMDRAVSRIDFRALAGKKVYLDSTPVAAITDGPYLTSLIRQHILASGGILKEKREEADYIVELRAGAVGTDRHDVLFGVPALSLPVAPVAGVPSQIPEIPLMKKTDQRGVAKIALFVYNRNTGRIVWQSGVIPEESKAKAVWFFGAGPFQRGSIYQGTKFAGDRFHIPLIDLNSAQDGKQTRVSVAEEAFFVEPKENENLAHREKATGDKTPDKQSASPQPASQQKAEAAPAGSAGVIQTGHTAPETPKAEGSGRSPSAVQGESQPRRAHSQGSPIAGETKPDQATPPGETGGRGRNSPSAEHGDEVPWMDPWPHLWR
jgi:hypothetical protein